MTHKDKHNILQPHEHADLHFYSPPPLHTRYSHLCANMPNVFFPGEILLMPFMQYLLDSII